MLRHFIAFNDLHNFPLPIEVYRNFFREEWLNKKLPIDSFDINNPHETKSERRMTQEDIDSNKAIVTGKYYPETRDENIKILDDYLTFCEENNIRPVMFTVPVTEKYMAKFNKKLRYEFYRLVRQALKKHSGTVFIDGWKWKGVTYADFKNHGHLNIHGAAKFSTFLNEIIEYIEGGESDRVQLLKVFKRVDLSVAAEILLGSRSRACEIDLDISARQT